MGERKKLTMYYPPDFDPRLVPRIKRDPNFTCEVRMMLPFSVQCNTCGEFMYMGKKFNSKKENAQGEKYKGIQIIRFYIKCSTCSAEMSFKTDPENGDYAMEAGGSRTFEMWKEKNAVDEANLEERLKEDNQDNMKALENRTIDSKKEMDILDALDELKAINQRKERVDTEAVLNTTASLRAKKESEEELGADESQLLAAFKQNQKSMLASTTEVGDADDMAYAKSLLGDLEGSRIEDKKKPKKKKKKRHKEEEPQEEVRGKKEKEKGKGGEEAAGGGVGGGSGGGVGVGMKPSPAALALEAIQKGSEDAAMDGSLSSENGSAAAKGSTPTDSGGGSLVCTLSASELLRQRLKKEQVEQTGSQPQVMPTLKLKKRKAKGAVEGSKRAKRKEEKKEAAKKGEGVEKKKPSSATTTTTTTKTQMEAAEKEAGSTSPPPSAPLPPTPESPAPMGSLLGLASYGSSGSGSE